MRTPDGSKEEDLSPRQKQILLLAAQGLTDRQIAGEIGLGEGTVRTYWERIRARLDARSRSEAIARSMSNEYRDAMADLERMRTLLAAVPEFLWTAQPTGEVDYVNDWFAKFSGRETKEYLGEGCKLLMPEHETIGSAIRWRTAQMTGQGYSALVHFLDAEDVPRLHRVSLTPLLDLGGKIMKWVGSAHAVEPIKPDTTPESA